MDSNNQNQSPVTPVPAAMPQDSMPMAPSEPVQAMNAVPAPAAVPATGGNLEKPLGEYKLLLAEDEEDARIIYLDILKGAGFDIDGAENGQSTLDHLAKKKYDLLLLDIIMPDLDGISVLSEIKKSPDKYGTPKVVMLTNIGGDLAIEKALSIGASGYMLKSETEPEDLIKIIKRYLAGETNVKL